jgi:hypothetical protein
VQNCRKVLWQPQHKLYLLHSATGAKESIGTWTTQSQQILLKSLQKDPIISVSIKTIILVIKGTVVRVVVVVPLQSQKLNYLSTQITQNTLQK